MSRLRGPQRIQLRRTKGWRKPEGAIVVARPTKWGNEFTIGKECDLDVGGVHHRFVVVDRRQAVALFREWQAAGLRQAARRELRGHDLACWCPPDQPCHADVLLEIANG